MPIKVEQKTNLAEQISINVRTTLHVVGKCKLQDSDGAQVRRDQSLLILLGCIAMALNTANDIALSQVEESVIITPN